MRNTPIIDFVGLEIESEVPISGQIQRRMNTNYWKVDHDASIESDAFVTVGGLRLGEYPDSLKGSLPIQSALAGTELVLNPPYNTETNDDCGLLQRLEELTSTLMAMGEGEDNLRSGIHYHISMPNSLSIVKSIIKNGALLEDVFFLMGGQGRIFRGALKNESQYCRPITGVGPQCVPTVQERVAQVFDIHGLLNARNSSELWWRYGNLTMKEDVPRYHPTRYTWLNLYSLWAHGTLEFRCFNTTLDPYIIYSELMFCKAFCQYVISSVYGTNERPLEVNSIYDQRSKNDILNTFQEFSWLAKVPTERMNLLGDVVSKSPQFVLPKRYLYSHLLQKMHFSFDFSNCDGIKYIDPEDVLVIKVDDIHLRHGER